MSNDQIEIPESHKRCELCKLVKPRTEFRPKKSVNRKSSRQLGDTHLRRCRACEDALAEVRGSTHERNGESVKDFARQIYNVEPEADLGDFVSEVVREFGGASEFAKKLASCYESAPNAQKSTYLRLVARLVEAASEHSGHESQIEMMSLEDLQRELCFLLRTACGPRCRMLCEAANESEMPS